MTFSDRLPAKLILWSVVAAAAAFLTDIALNYLGWENTPGAEVEAVLTVGLMVYLFVLLRKLVVKPLEEIERTAQKIKAGDLTARINIKTSRELEVLSEAMNSMVEKLASQYKQLQVYSQDLERLVEERTSQLNSEREMHISLLTHDLKSPLTSIMGYADLMLSEDPPAMGAQEKEFVESILANSRRLLNMVEQYLDIAKMDSGALTLSRTTFALDSLIEDVVSDLNFQAREKHISIDTRIASGLRQMEGDRDKLGRVLANLVNNAIKYTPDGGSVGISAEGIDGDGEGSIKITVSDTGYGIPENEVGRIFDRYYRSSSITGVKGTGLGLAVVKSLVEAHSGSVAVTSRRGEGTTFIVELPVGQKTGEDTVAD